MQQLNKFGFFILTVLLYGNTAGTIFHFWELTVGKRRLQINAALIFMLNFRKEISDLSVDTWFPEQLAKFQKTVDSLSAHFGYASGDSLAKSLFTTDSSISWDEFLRVNAVVPETVEAARIILPVGPTLRAWDMSHSLTTEKFYWLLFCYFVYLRSNNWNPECTEEDRKVWLQEFASIYRDDSEKFPQFLGELQSILESLDLM